MVAGGKLGRGCPPAPEADIETLTFPRPMSVACTKRRIELPISPCYSWNDLSGLSVDAITLDDGDNRFIGGEELSLSGGLTAAPAPGSSKEAVAVSNYRYSSPPHSNGV